MSSKAQGKAATNNTAGTAVDQALLEQAEREAAEGRPQDPELGTMRSAPAVPTVTGLQRALAQIVCCGRYVKKSEGGDVAPERALMRFAAVTTKAVAIALACEKMVEDEHDVELSYQEASMALLGVSELLSAAPRLIDELQGFDIRSNGETRPWNKDDDEGGADESEVAS